MPALTATPVAISRGIRVDGLAFTPVALRKHRPQTASEQLTVSGADSTLTKLGGAAWLTVPAGSTNGVPFAVALDASELKCGHYAETIRASAGGFDPVDVIVTLNVVPAGAR